jgi:hypothetical protein
MTVPPGPDPSGVLGPFAPLLSEEMPKVGSFGVVGSGPHS